MSAWKKYIETDIKKISGKPVIVNTRVPVDFILEKWQMGLL